MPSIETRSGGVVSDEGDHGVFDTGLVVHDGAHVRVGECMLVERRKAIATVIGPREIGEQASARATQPRGGARGRSILQKGKDKRL